MRHWTNAFGLVRSQDLICQSPKFTRARCFVKGCLPVFKAVSAVSSSFFAVFLFSLYNFHFSGSRYNFASLIHNSQIIFDCTVWPKPSLEIYLAGWTDHVFNFFSCDFFFKVLKINTTKKDLCNNWMCATTKLLLIPIFLFHCRILKARLRSWMLHLPTHPKHQLLQIHWVWFKLKLILWMALTHFPCLQLRRLLQIRWLQWLILPQWPQKKRYMYICKCRILLLLWFWRPSCQVGNHMRNSSVLSFLRI